MLDHMKCFQRASGGAIASQRLNRVPPIGAPRVSSRCTRTSSAVVRARAASSRPRGRVDLPRASSALHGHQVLNWSETADEVNENAVSAYLYDEESMDSDDFEDDTVSGIHYRSAIEGAWNAESIADAKLRQEQAGTNPSPLEAIGTMASPVTTAPPPSPYTAAGGFREVSPKCLQQMIEQHNADPEGHMMVVIDVRDEEEYTWEHVPGSLSVPFERLSETIRSSGLHLCPDIPIAIIGSATSMYPGIPGTTSAQANVRLRRVFGFTDVVSLEGGLLGWLSAGLAVDSGRT